MAQYRYTAIDAAGQTRRGVMEADSEAEVVASLQRQGSVPMHAEPATGRRLTDLLLRDIGRRGMRRQDVANFTRELSIILGAGQDLDRSLRFLVETALNERIRATSEALRQSVRDGGSLAAALARHPASFPRLYVGLVRAGEAGGTLAPTLRHLAALLEKEQALTSSVKSALIYPALLLVAAIGSITLLLTQVLPQFVPLFEQSGAKLPGATQMLVDAGALVSDFGLPALLAAMVLALLARRALQRPGVRLSWDRFLLRLPVAGGLAREVVAARFTRTLGTLLGNGVPLIAALAIVEDTLGNAAAVAAIREATASAKAGAGLARPLDGSAVFPPHTIHLLRLGEETAQLGAMALRAAEIHEENTRLGLQRLVALLVPSITVVMGAVIAGIVSSLLLAMLGLNDLAQ